MRKLLYIFLLLPVLATAQKFEIVQEELCWSTSVDSSVIRYSYISTRKTTPTLLFYTNQAGDTISVSSGTFANGFCDCCGNSGGSVQDTSAFRATGGLAKQNNPASFAFRSGNTAIGVDANTHKFRTDGSFQFNPEPGFVLDFQEGTGILGPIDHKSLVITSNLDNLSGAWPPPDGANLTFFKDGIVTDRDMLGSISFAARDDLNNVRNSAGIDVTSVQNWASGSAHGSTFHFWATSPTEGFARNVFTIEGDGRIELDRYNNFDDGVPFSILGFGDSFGTGIDMTRTPIDGTASDGDILRLNLISGHFEWADPSVLGGGSSLWSENDTTIFYNGAKDVGIGNNTATEKLDVTGNIKLSGNVIIDGLNKKVTSDYIARIKDIIFADNETVPSIDIGTTGGRWMSVQSGDEDGGLIFRTAQRFNPNELEDVLALRRGTAGIGTIAYDNVADARFAVKAGGYLTNYIVRFLDASDNVEFEISNAGNVQIGTSFDFASGARFTLPSFTTIARDALTANTGEFIFNSDEAKVEFYNGSSWKEIIIPGTNRTISVDASFVASDRNALIKIQDTTNDSDFTVYTLDSSPQEGDEIKCNCISASIDADDGCQINGNGKNINGGATFTFTSQFQGIVLKFDATEDQWYTF